MASFQSKLARLGGRRPAPTSSGKQAPATAESAPSARMVELKAKLERMLGATGSVTTEGGVTRQRRQSSRACLGLQHAKLADGELAYERRSYGHDERVGRLPLSHALGADMSQLALLGATEELAGLDVRDALYLDTESTGFGTGTGNLAFLVAAAWYDREAEAFVLQQCILEDPDEEVAMLGWLRQRIEAASWLVSYNGKSFDLPLVRGRMVMNRLPPLPPRPQLDLLHLARRIHRNRDWRKSLTSIEKEVLHYRRGHDVGGAEVARRYQRYLRWGDAELLRDVITHNERDVLSLVALVGWYGGAISALDGPEQLGVGQTLQRMRKLDAARGVLDRLLCPRAAAASARLGLDDAEALRSRAFVAKASGDKAQALRDFERLDQEHDDREARLELAKLYEHHLRDPTRALAVLQAGTSELPAAHEHRAERLRRKLGGRAANAQQVGLAVTAGNTGMGTNSGRKRSHPRKG